MKFIVQSPIKHKGKRHEVNAIVEIDEETAAPLLERGDVSPHKVSKVDQKAEAEAAAKAKAEAEAKAKAEAEEKARLEAAAAGKK